MAIALTFDADRCPDGVEIHDYGAKAEPVAGKSLLGGWSPFGCYVRPRTARVETLRLRLESLADALVLDLIRSDSGPALLDFMSRYGILNSTRGSTGVQEAPLDDAIRLRDHLRRTLALKGHADPMASINLFNRMASGPSLHLELLPRPSGEPPALSLRVSSLYGFMVAEAALLLCNETQLRTCTHCGVPFLVGAAGGKRANALYCTPKCRLAAFRARGAPH